MVEFVDVFVEAVDILLLLDDNLVELFDGVVLIGDLGFEGDDALFHCGLFREVCVWVLCVDGGGGQGLTVHSSPGCMTTTLEAPGLNLETSCLMGGQVL